MNYYSVGIINKIIDNSKDEELADSIDKFYDDIRDCITYYCWRDIDQAYINRLVEDETVKYAFRCMDTTEFYMSSVPSLMAYVVDKTEEIDTYYILLICTKHQFKNMGYASDLLQDFMEDVKEKCNKKGKPGKIVLSSIETAATFYEKIGFKWTRKCLSEYDVLLEYETCEEDKEYIMMEYAID